MSQVTHQFLTEQLALAEELLAGRDVMLEPQDLPGRFGRVIHAVDHLLQAIHCPAALAGGWAVWRHGYFARMTQDVDVVLPADRIDEFLKVASVSGFEILPQPKGRWPKVLHKDTNIKVDILPEGARPGSASRPAPTTIRHPSEMGGREGALRYIDLPPLIELKIAAGRVQDEADVIALVRENMDKVDAVRAHLSTIHADYVAAFDRLVERARDQDDV